MRLPPVRPWSEAYRYLERNWRVGDHMTLVAKTGGGKTTFAREVLDIRDWVVVLGTKARDADLYPPLQRKGYVIKRKWSPSDTDDNRVIFAPPLPAPTKEGRAAQAEAFREVLVELFNVGRWTVYADEIRYLTHDLGLTVEVDTLYLQGRSLELTLVAATQRPRGVPRNVFAMARWFGLWRVSNAEDRLSASELVGGLAPMAREAMALLPPHELLLIDSVRDEAMRTKVYTE